MKFREFVGEKKVREVQEIVKTDRSTPKAFIEQVLIPSYPKYFGFGLSKKHLKKTFDYIKSWLIRYDIPFKSISPCLTLYLLHDLPSVSVLVNNISKTDKFYKPM